MQGIDVIKNAVLNAPTKSGVYKMFNNSHILIYVGKAKNIKNRLNSYTKAEVSPKTAVLIQSVCNIEFEITQSEQQALILEASLIKQHQPKYNILLKDDKSRIYIKLSSHKFPSISTYRGKFDRKSHLFGPFGYIQGSSLPVNYTIKNIMGFVSKIFGIRSCKDTKLKIHQSMNKPCMEYQIGTCSAPCTKHISQEGYQENVQKAINFLQGGYLSLAKDIKQRITHHAQKNEFTEAGNLKNQLTAIESLRLKLDINFHKYENLDIIAINSTLSCIEVFSIRNGYTLGGNIFTINKTDLTPEEIIEQFIIQHYSAHNPPPKTIFTNKNINNKDIQAVLAELLKTKTNILFPKQGENKQIIDFVLTNLEHQSKKQSDEDKIFPNGLQLITTEFNLTTTPQRVEVYDNSHTNGTFFIGSFIVFNETGFVKSQYRKFNAKFSKGGDDYGMMKEVMLRRFNPNSSITEKPDLIIIDGGLGQLNAVKQIFQEMNINIPTISIAKGENRNAGNETFFTPTKHNIKIQNTQLLHFLQIVRDEAHRFAITTHRKRRDKI